LGIAINSTGGAAAPDAPVAELQRDVMIQAFERAGKDPREVDYVELHATGKFLTFEYLCSYLQMAR